MALNRGIVQVEGIASILDVDTLRTVADQSVAFRTTLIRHEQAQFAQAQQSAACNVSHSVEARLSRWLLRTRDATGSDTLGLTQEFLAQMLGVRRTSVSLVANTLQAAGLIRYRRGRIEITNLEGLQETSCECYETVKVAQQPADRQRNGASKTHELNAIAGRVPSRSIYLLVALKPKIRQHAVADLVGIALAGLGDFHDSPRDHLLHQAGLAFVVQHPATLGVGVVHDLDHFWDQIDASRKTGIICRRHGVLHAWVGRQILRLGANYRSTSRTSIRFFPRCRFGSEHIRKYFFGRSAP